MKSEVDAAWRQMRDWCQVNTAESFLVGAKDEVKSELAGLEDDGLVVGAARLSNALGYVSTWQVHHGLRSAADANDWGTFRSGVEYAIAGCLARLVSAFHGGNRATRSGLCAGMTKICMAMFWVEFCYPSWSEQFNELVKNAWNDDRWIPEDYKTVRPVDNFMLHVMGLGGTPLDPHVMLLDVNSLGDARAAMDACLDFHVKRIPDDDSRWIPEFRDTPYNLIPLELQCAERKVPALQGALDVGDSGLLLCPLEEVAKLAPDPWASEILGLLFEHAVLKNANEVPRTE